MKNKNLVLMASLLAVSVTSAFAMDKKEAENEESLSPTVQQNQSVPLSSLIESLQDPQPVEPPVKSALQKPPPLSFKFVEIETVYFKNPESPKTISPKAPSPKTDARVRRKGSLGAELNKPPPESIKGHTSVSPRPRTNSLGSPCAHKSPLKQRKNSLGNSPETASPEIRDPSPGRFDSLKEKVLKRFSRPTSSQHDEEQSPVQEHKTTTTSREEMSSLRYTIESEQPNSSGSPEPSSGREQKDSFASPVRFRQDREPSPQKNLSTDSKSMESPRKGAQTPQRSKVNQGSRRVSLDMHPENIATLHRIREELREKNSQSTPPQEEKNFSPKGDVKNSKNSNNLFPL